MAVAGKPAVGAGEGKEAAMPLHGGRVGCTKLEIMIGLALEVLRRRCKRGKRGDPKARRRPRMLSCEVLLRELQE